MPTLELAPWLKAVLDALMPFLKDFIIFEGGKEAEKLQQQSATSRANLESLQDHEKNHTSVAALPADQLRDELLHGPR